MSTESIQRNETFLRIPMKIVIADHQDDEETNKLVYKGAPYSVRLACKLLREKALAEESSWYPYIQSLPPRVSCPLLDFTSSDLLGLDYNDVVEQLESYKAMVDKSWNKLELEAHGKATMDEYLWAMSIVHSRSFGTDGKRGPLGIHMLVPLVDMFNHGGDFYQVLYRKQIIKLDSAEWRLVRPELAQSGMWEMEVKASSSIEPNCEILMSYGERSNDDFFLYYGFIPPMNPNDDYVLFPRLDEALDWYKDQFLTHEDPVHVNELIRKTKKHGEVEDGVSGGDPSVVREHRKLRIMSGGFVDSRLLTAFDELSEMTKVTTTQAIKRRCWQLLKCHTPLLHDLKMLAENVEESEHNFPLLLQFYSRVLEKFEEAGGELPAAEELPNEESGVLSFAQRLIKTYMCYKKFILWDIQDVAAGGMHTVVLLKDGTVWSFGVNDEGALGRPTTQPGEQEGDPTLPGRVELPRDAKKPVQVVCTDSGSFILTEDGAIYGCGTFRNASGVLGFSHQVDIQTRFVKIYNPSYKTPAAVKLSAGSNHVLAVLKNGGALSWGDGDQGQLGRIPLRTSRRGNNLKKNTLTPARIQGFRGVDFSDASCGEFTSFLMSSEGQFYGFGLNNSGQLAIHPSEGITNEETLDLEDRVEKRVSILKPTLLEALENNAIVTVASGKDHSLGVDVRGRVYSWGVPTYGVLGREEMFPHIEESTAYPIPELVSRIKAPVTEVACGQVISGCIDTDGEVYTWGAALNDMLGVNEEEDILLPRKIPRNQSMKGKRFSKIAFGGQHVALLGE
eukprot:g1443.t1